MGIRMENERLLHDAEKKRAFCLEILYSLSKAFHLLCHIYEEVYDLSRLPPQSACSCDRCVCVIKILNLRHVRSSSPSNCCKSTTRAMRSCWLCVSSKFSSDTSTTAATLTMSKLSAWHKQLRWQIRMQCSKKKSVHLHWSFWWNLNRFRQSERGESHSASNYNRLASA